MLMMQMMLMVMEDSFKIPRSAVLSSLALSLYFTNVVYLLLLLAFPRNEAFGVLLKCFDALIMLRQRRHTENYQAKFVLA